MEQRLTSVEEETLVKWVLHCAASYIPVNVEELKRLATLLIASHDEIQPEPSRLGEQWSLGF